MPPKMKVFQAQFGFYEAIIATTSQTAALKAWGTHQNLFASGEAKLCEDEAAAAAALKHPGTTLRRPLGSAGAFAMQPSGLPEIPKGEKVGLKGPREPRKVSRPRPSRSEPDAAEKALRDLEESRKEEEADFQREAEALAARRSAAQNAYVSRRRQATAAVKAARDAYRKAGGTG
jgi:hypothetical protein